MHSHSASTARAHQPAAELESIAAGIAARAAAVVRRRLGRATALSTKSTPTDVVTATDLEVETLIRGALLAATPEAAILGEEGTAIGSDSGLEWIVDPIDGTINFLYDLPVIAVSLAASVNGELVAGCVADVVRDEIFSAHKGGGARLDGSSVSTSDVSTLSQALIATGFSYASDRRREQAEVIGRILPATRDLRCFGSAALHLAWVGCGRIDGYWQSETEYWDVAAGRLIAAEGGAEVDVESTAGSGSVLAAGPAIAPALRTLVLG